MTDDNRAEANRKARDARKEAYLRAIYERYLAQFGVAAAGGVASFAHEVHQAMDLVLERDRGNSADSAGIRCGRGCSHCCHEPVEIWPAEAALLVRITQEAGTAPDPTRLERQSRHDIDTWREQPMAQRACVFLGTDGACTVYDHRPNACRKLLVVTDPALCNPEHRKPDSVGRWFSWEAELMESAALEVFGAMLMPVALLAAMADAPAPANPEPPRA